MLSAALSSAADLSFFCRMYISRSWEEIIPYFPSKTFPLYFLSFMLFKILVIEFNYVTSAYSVPDSPFSSVQLEYQWLVQRIADREKDRLLCRSLTPAWKRMITVVSTDFVACDGKLSENTPHHKSIG